METDWTNVKCSVFAPRRGPLLFLLPSVWMLVAGVKERPGNEKLIWQSRPFNDQTMCRLITITIHPRRVISKKIYFDSLYDFRIHLYDDDDDDGHHEGDAPILLHRHLAPATARRTTPSAARRRRRGRAWRASAPSASRPSARSSTASTTYW